MAYFGCVSLKQVSYCLAYSRSKFTASSDKLIDKGLKNRHILRLSFLV